MAIASEKRRDEGQERVRAKLDDQARRRVERIFDEMADGETVGQIVGVSPRNIDRLRDELRDHHLDF